MRNAASVSASRPDCSVAPLSAAQSRRIPIITVLDTHPDTPPATTDIPATTDSPPMSRMGLMAAIGKGNGSGTAMVGERATCVFAADPFTFIKFATEHQET